MKFGGAMFFTEYSMTAPELAVALEQRGYDSIWAPEHSHIPLSRKTPFPGGGELPKQYDLSSLRLLGTVGEPINPEAWMWYYNTVGQSRCPIVVEVLSLPNQCAWNRDSVKNRRPSGPFSETRNRLSVESLA